MKEQITSSGQGRNRSRKANRRIKLAMLAASAASALPMLVGNQPAQAADLWWDINGTTTGGAGTGTSAAGAAGTWNASNTNWSTASAGNVATSTWSGQSGTTARFAAGTNVSNAYTVTVGDAESVSGLVFEEGTITLSGASGSLNIPSTGTFIITSLKNNDNNITVPIIGSANMLITGKGNGDGTGTQPGNISKVDITGDLTNFTGALTIDSGNSLSQTCILQLDSPLGNTSNTINIGQFGGLGTTNMATGMNLTIANPIAINGDSSIFNSNTGTTGTQRITNFTGSISGSGNLYVGFMNGAQSGGRGTVVLGNASTAQYTYTGDTYDLMASNNGLVQLGKDNILPATGNLIFGASTAGSAAFAPVDLNGHSVTVKGLVTNTTGQALIMNTAVDATPAAVTLTIDGGLSTSSSTFGGVIGSTNTGINPFNNEAPYFVSGVSHVTAGANISLVKNGSTTQVLTGANTYTGDTTVNGGTLTLGKRFGTQSTPGTVTNTVAGNVIVNTGATLSTVAGTSASNTYFSAAGGSITSGGTVSPGTDSNVGGLYASSLSLNTGSTLKFDLPSATADYDSIKLTGGLTLDSGTHSVVLNSAPGAGTYTLLSYASRTWDGTNGFTLPTDPHWSGNFSDTALTLQVTDPSTHIYVWDVGGGGQPVTDGSGTWVSDPTNTDPNAHNWLDIGPNAEAVYDNANPNNPDVVIGNNASGVGGTITMGGNITVGGKLTFGPISSAYTVTDGGNAYTLTVNAAKGVEADSNATIDASVSVSGDSHWNIAAGKTLTVTKSVHAGAFDTLFKDGNGALVVNGTGGTVGAITIDGGTFESNDAGLLGPAFFNLAQGTTLKITTPVNITGDVTALDRTTAGQNFTWDFGANNVTFSGAIALKGNVTKKGTGDFTISGNNANFSGGNNVGILTISDSSTLHFTTGTPLGVSPSWENLRFSNPSTLDVQTDAVIGSIRDGSQITKIGFGKLTVSSNDTATAGSSPSIDVQQGSLQIDSVGGLGGGNSNTFGQMAITLENNTELVDNFQNARNSLSITMNGNSTLTLANTSATQTDSEFIGYNTNGTTFTNYGSVLTVNGNNTIRSQQVSTVFTDPNTSVQSVISHDLMISMPLHVTAGNSLTITAANTAGDYGKAAVLLRGTDNAGGHPADDLFIDGGATVDSSASVGELHYGSTGRGKPIVGVGPGTALLKLGSHAFMRDLGSSSDTNNGTVMTRLAVLNGVNLRVEAPMNATYTVPNPGGAPLLRTYDGTTGLLGANTTDTFGNAPTGYTNIQNGYTVLSPNRAHALSNTFNPNGFTATAPSGTLTLAATDSADATGVINAGPNQTCGVGVALDNTAASANANLTYQIDGSADGGKFANFASLTVQKTSAGGGSVKAQLLSTTKIPQVAINNGTKLDVQDQKLILSNTPVGTWNGSAYTDATSLIASGYGVNQDFSGSGDRHLTIQCDGRQHADQRRHRFQHGSGPGDVRRSERGRE